MNNPIEFDEQTQNWRRIPTFAHLQHTPTYFNLGDTVSCPKDYLYPTSQAIELTSIDEHAAGTEPLIIGGGGIFYGDWPLRYAKWAKERELIAWGCGLNYDCDSSLDSNITIAMGALSRFRLVGIRDRELAWKYGFNWVPCASCLHPAFGRLRPSGSQPAEMVFYSHPWMPVTDPKAFELPRLSNMDPSLTLLKVLEFIISGQVLLTNSYHGAYWAQLLGVPVLLLTGNNLIPQRFLTGLPYVPQVVRSVDEARYLIKLGHNSLHCDPWLDHCQQSNLAFKEKVDRVLRYNTKGR